MSLRRVTLNQMRIFEAAARHQHFGSAAAELHLTQPAVSIQLRQFETMSACRCSSRWAGTCI